jgi:hypothetical protein
MGVLTASGAMGADGSMPANAAPTEDNEPEETSETPVAARAEEKPEFIPFSKLTPKTPGSRRQKAEEELETRIKTKFEESWKARESSYEQRLREQSENLARLQGMVEATQQQQRQAPAPSQAATVDPEALIAEGTELLNRGDLAGYHKKLRQAMAVESDMKAESKIRTMREEFEKKIPQQVPQEIQVLMSRHHNVAMAGPDGIQAVQMKDNELRLRGVPPGPARVAKAFEQADQFLASIRQPTSRQTYSDESAAALSAVPTNRPAASGGSGGEAGHNLTQLQRDTAKTAGMTTDEYIKWTYPEKFLRNR